MRVGTFLETALAFERGLESLYRDLAEHVEAGADAARFLECIADEEGEHAARIQEALSGINANETVATADPARLSAVLEMLAEIHEDVRESRLQPHEAWEILAHMETFAEERFYGGIPDAAPGLPTGLVRYLKDTCAGHARRFGDRIADSSRKDGVA